MPQYDPLVLPSAVTITIKDPRWYPATIEDITDGDTIVVSIDRGHDQGSRRQAIRLRGIDTAESSSTDPRLNKLGMLAQLAISSLLPVGSPQFLITYKTPKAMREELEKFGRFQGDFVLSVDVSGTMSTLTEYLIRNRLAVSYRGQNKTATLAGHLGNYQYHVERGSFASLRKDNV